MENIEVDNKIISFINGSNTTENTKKAVYYNKQFSNFNGLTLFKLSWNWASFFLGWVHLVYRKLYLFGAILGGIYFLLTIKFIKEDIFIKESRKNFTISSSNFGNLPYIIMIITFYLIITGICCGLFANFLIYLRYKNKNKKVEAVIPNDEQKQIEYLIKIGGKNKGLAILLGIIYYGLYIYMGFIA